MSIDIITQYILAIVPAVTAIMSMVVLVGVGIGKIKKANHITEEKVEKMSKGNKELKEELNQVLKENILLKKSMNELNAKLDNIKVIKKKD